MVAFTPVVQADFSGTAFGGVPTWTDITRFARLGPSPARITKWRQDQLSDVAPSTMTLVLDNMEVAGDATAPNAGRFTPFLTSSPWSPHILPGVRIRVGVIVNAVTFWRFDGYVDVWDASYDNGEFGICTVSASDMLARLGILDQLRAMYVEECLTDTPLLFYPLTEPAGSSAAGSVAATAGPTLMVGQIGGRGDVTFAAATGVPTDGSSTATMNTTLSATSSDDAVGDYLWSGFIGPPSVSRRTLEAVVTVNPNLASVLSRQPAGTNRALIIGTGNLPAGIRTDLAVKYNAGAVQLVGAAGAAVGPDLNDGHLHHLAVTIDSVAISTTWYVDGVAVSTDASSSTTGTPVCVRVGGADPTEFVGSVAFPSFRGGIGYAAMYPAALSAARIAAHNTAARTAFAGEGTSTHITRLLSYRTNLGATLDAGQGSVATHAIAGTTLQQALLDTAKAEGGLVYADPATGKIVFLDRSHLRDPASVLTLDITAQQTTPDLNVRADRDLLLNDATISRPGGVAQRKVDQTSKNTYGVKGQSETRIIGSDLDVANAAGWLVANGKDVRARTPALSVDLLTEPSLTVAAGVLNLVPLQRVTLSNPPASMPAADVIVQGCTDTIGVGEFNCAFFVSPMPRPTLRFDAAADAFTKLDSGNVFAW